MQIANVNNYKKYTKTYIESDKTFKFQRRIR